LLKDVISLNKGYYFIEEVFTLVAIAIILSNYISKKRQGIFQK